LAISITPALAQAPPPVPALPDAQRQTTYTISGTTCACAVGFQIYGDGSDIDNWLEVWIGGVRYFSSNGSHGWTITSPSGPLNSIARPITDAVLTFNQVQTGTIQIVGARRPRRTSQFPENRGVAARDFNQAITDLVAQNRETWDKTNDLTGRGLFFQPGVTAGAMPTPSQCQSKFLGFDNTGFNPQCVQVVTTGAVVLPTCATNVPLVGSGTSTPSCWPSGALAAPIPRQEVIIQRNSGSYAGQSAKWSAIAADGSLLCMADGTPTSQCVTDAIAAAFPYASGTTAIGYDLRVIGGDSPAFGSGLNFGGAAAGLSSDWNFPPIQGGSITVGAISTQFVNFDALEMVTVDFCHGSQTESVSFKPTNGTPLDNSHGVSPAIICFQTVNGTVRFDLSGNALANVTATNLHIVELNASGLASGCALRFDSPAAGQNMGNLHVQVEQLHSLASGSTAFCLGTTTPHAGQILGSSVFDIFGAPDATNTANFADIWGTNNQITLHAGGFNTGYTLKLEAGACGNEVHIWSDQAYSLGSTVINSSGCTNNVVYWNGVLEISPFARSQATPGNPTGTTSTGGVMAGLAGTITPAASGNVLLNINGSASNGTSGDGCTFKLRYGTGAAPSNAAALTGTVAGNANGQSMTSATGGAQQAIGITAYVTGLTPGTAYWLDVSEAAVTGGTCSLFNPTIVAIEQ
jgi:hypothetical protein